MGSRMFWNGINKMFVVFGGRGCAECPFLHESMEHDTVVRTCNLDGIWVSALGREISIKLGRDGKRKGDCPFKMSQKVTVEVIHRGK